MENRFVLIMKWVSPIVIMTLAICHFSGIIIDKWLGLTIIFITAALFTISLIIKKHSHP